MLDIKTVNELVKQVLGALPPPLKAGCPDFDKNMSAVLQAALSRLDLVTRDEFDTQTKVLLKTRQQLEQLANRVDALSDQNEKL